MSALAVLPRSLENRPDPGASDHHPPVNPLPPELAPVAALMRGFPAPWCIAGGWALDLFLGRVTRPHADVDLALFREDQTALQRHFVDWEFRKAVEGELVDWPADEWLSLPIHEIHARRTHGEPSALEFLLNERDGNEWVFRRDPAVRLPVDRLILRSDAGLPILCPEVVLLYKSRNPRETDVRDLKAGYAALSRERQQWLDAQLALVSPRHLGHERDWRVS